MQYMLSIFSEEGDYDSVPPEAAQAMLDAYWAFEASLQEAGGVRIAGEALQPGATATKVEVRDGQKLITDGPFIETKEQLGGFYLLECRDLDEALEWAARCPGSHHGTIEVRAVMQFDAPDAGSAEGAAQGAQS
jgi:hypothetical protein